MSHMPETIWIDSINNDGVGVAFHPKPHSKICHTEEYTRTDKYEALRASHDRLVDLLKKSKTELEAGFESEQELEAEHSVFAKLLVNDINQSLAKAEKVSGK